MNRSLITALAPLIGLYLLTSCATTPPANPDDVCSIFDEKRTWHAVAVKAEKKWGNQLQIPMAIMYQESAFKHKARPPRRYLLGFIPWRRPTTAYGYAQAVNGTWAQYKRSTGEKWRDRTKFVDATDFIHWYMNQAIERNGIDRGDVYNLYLNYHEGLVGFSRKTYSKKLWLQRAASNTRKRAERYAVQYAGCKDSLKPGFWRRLFGG